MRSLCSTWSVASGITIICIFVISLVACSQRSSSNAKLPLMGYTDSSLLNDLRSDRRDYLRIAVYFLVSHGAPEEGHRKETLVEWEDAAARMRTWLAGQKKEKIARLVSDYPAFRAVQSPYYPD